MEARERTRGTGAEGGEELCNLPCACLPLFEAPAQQQRPTDWRSKFAIDLCLGSGFGVSPFGEGFLHFKCVPKAALKLFCKSELSSEMPCPTCSGYACKNTENGAAAALKKDCHYAQQVVYHSGVISAPATVAKEQHE